MMANPMITRPFLARFWRVCGVLGLLLIANALSIQPVTAQVPEETQQLIVGIAAHWDDSHVTLQRYERHGKSWRSVGEAWPGRLGKSGLVWGRGLHTSPKGVRLKVEGDSRAPAGVFALGEAYGHFSPDQVARHNKLPYTKVGPYDLWVEDASSPFYNQHVRLGHAEPRTRWEKKQQMKQSDPAHSLKLFIAHNSQPNIVPGAGSAIFFHIWRSNGGRPTTGCTTMSEARLRDLLAWLDPTRHPLYVLLPKAEYDALRKPWKLP